MKVTDLAIKIFNESIRDYHIIDNIDSIINNKYDKNSLENLFYLKSWIDTVQWHLEDVIRNPNIEPLEALSIKRRIDLSNQERTDIVEYIDSWYLDKYKGITSKSDAKINTESPAWAFDRLSILCLKIYHMDLEVNRKDASYEHKTNCQKKLDILLEQQKDLSEAIEDLLKDIERGYKYMKTYKQMKMYNDPNLNPILYKKK